MHAMRHEMPCEPVCLPRLIGGLSPIDLMGLQLATVVLENAKSFVAHHVLQTSRQVKVKDGNG